MPEVHGDHLDVSSEEERYLRRVFRRFALPYVVLGLALGALTGALPGWLGPRDAGGEAGDVEDPRLREEIGALRGDVASLSQRAVAAESALARARDRLVALEGRGGAPGGSTTDSEEIARRVEASVRRIEALEQQISAGAAPPAADATLLEERVAALGGRLARLEGELRAERAAGPPADLAR
jgi:hypothetical protein